MEVDVAGKIIYFHGPWRHHGELLNIFRQQFQTINKDDLDPMGKISHPVTMETFDRSDWLTADGSDRGTGDPTTRFGMQLFWMPREINGASGKCRFCSMGRLNSWVCKLIYIYYIYIYIYISFCWYISECTHTHTHNTYKLIIKLSYIQTVKTVEDTQHLQIPKQSKKSNSSYTKSTFQTSYIYFCSKNSHLRLWLENCGMAGTAFFGASAASAPGSLGVVVLGGAPCECVNGKDDIPYRLYMKWKIIHSCLKPPTRYVLCIFW